MLTPLEKDIRQNLKWNLAANMTDGALFGAALGFASFSAVLPLFVASMTDSALLIGLVPAIHSVGWQLPQLFTASRVSRLRAYKPSVLALTIHERVPFLGLAFIALTLPYIGAKAGLILTFLMLVWQGLGGGFTANAWQSMVAKIFPPEYRGTFFGFQAGLANLFISGSAIAAGYLLDKFQAPYGFAACFFAASVLFAASWFALAYTREPEDAEKVIPAEKSHFWEDSKKIMKKDANFRWFLATRILAQFATMGFSFYILYALRSFGMTEVVAGYLTAAYTIAKTAANMGMGWLGDKIGHRAMLILGGIAALLSAVLAWSAASLTWFYSVYVLMGVAEVSIWTNGMSITADFGSTKERPIYIGLSQTLVAPATILAPLLGGLMVDAAGFLPAFLLSAALSAAMIFMLVFKVKEPRGKDLKPLT